METSTQRERADDIDDVPAYGAVTDGTDISRFFIGFLPRLMAVVFAVALASIGHGLSSTDGTKVEKFHHVDEAGAER